MAERQYKLELLFSSRDREFEKFRASMKNALNAYPAEITLEITKTRPARGWTVTITGSLETVDKCHGEINKVLISKLGYHAVRLEDGVGDEIRKRAYVVVARVEQKLRRFIGRATREIAGFNWFESRIPSDLRETADKIRKSKAKNRELLDPLESIQFEHLLDIVVAEVSEWQPDRALSASDLSDLLADCTSVEQLQTKIENKTKKLSLWDDVFAKYFPDAQEWKELEKAIRLVIEERHKVMHHRPIRWSDLQNLRKWEREIDKSLNAAAGKLSTAKRKEALTRFNEFGEAIRRQYEDQLASISTITRPSFHIDTSFFSPLGGIMADMNRGTEAFRSMQESMMLFPSMDISRLLGPTNLSSLVSESLFDQLARGLAMNQNILSPAPQDHEASSDNSDDVEGEGDEPQADDENKQEQEQ